MKTAGLIAIAALLTAAPTISRAQNYPSRPITLVVPFASGGATDTHARLLAHKLSERIGVPVVIEYRPGAATGLAASLVAKETPDGYKLLMVTNGTMAINLELYRKLDYDPTKDFVPVSLVASYGHVLVVNPSLPVRSAGDLAAFAKENPGKLVYAVAGSGSPSHLSAELLKSISGTEMKAAIYDDGAKAMAGLVAGNASLLFSEITTALPVIRQGSVRALGVSPSRRIPAAASIPTIEEAGVPKFDLTSWRMIVAPARTPSSVVNRLHDELKAVLALPDYHQQITALGLIPLTSPSPHQLNPFVSSEIKRWSALVQKAGLSASQ